MSKNLKVSTPFNTLFHPRLFMVDYPNPALYDGKVAGNRWDAVGYAKASGDDDGEASGDVAAGPGPCGLGRFPSLFWHYWRVRPGIGTSGERLRQARGYVAWA